MRNGCTPARVAPIANVHGAGEADDDDDDDDAAGGRCDDIKLDNETGRAIFQHRSSRLCGLERWNVLAIGLLSKSLFSNKV